MPQAVENKNDVKDEKHDINIKALTGGDIPYTRGPVIDLVVNDQQLHVDRLMQVGQGGITVYCGPPYASKTFSAITLAEHMRKKFPPQYAICTTPKGIQLHEDLLKQYNIPTYQSPQRCGREQWKFLHKIALNVADSSMRNSDFDGDLAAKEPVLKTPGIAIKIIVPRLKGKRDFKRADKHFASRKVITHNYRGKTSYR